MVGTTLNMEPQESTLKNKPPVPDSHLKLLKRTHATVEQCHRPVVVVWTYQDRVVLHQIIFNNDGHTQVGSCQRPQHTEAKSKGIKSHPSWTLL